MAFVFWYLLHLKLTLFYFSVTVLSKFDLTNGVAQKEKNVVHSSDLWEQMERSIKLMTAGMSRERNLNINM